MHLILVVPHLFWPGRPGDDEARAAYEGLETPALELLLARGRQRALPLHTAGWEGWLARQFGLVEAPSDDASDDDARPIAELPLAPYRLRGDGIDPGDAAWICLDPVHLQLLRDTLALDPTAAATLTDAEAQTLREVLARHFAQDGIEPIAPHPARWYARLTGTPAIRTRSPAAAAGHPVDRTLPEGEDAARWRQVMNESQMLLFEHPVNEAREARGEPALNSVWAWGTGVERPLATRPRGERWLAADPLARGLALAGGASAGPAPESLASLGSSDGRLHVVLDAPSEAAMAGDLERWRAAIDAIESRWAAPALAGLRAGRIGMLTVHAVGLEASLAVETVAGDLRYFWRRRRPLASYV